MTTTGRGRFVSALVVAIALIVSSPFAGEIRGVVRAAFPGAFRWIVAGLLTLAAGTALTVALRRIRDHRWSRLGAIVIALVIAAVAARGVSGGNLDVDLVEDIHFVEYGILAVLFYRVWLGRGDWSVLALPVVASFTAAILDEFVQWFVPYRVGEVRDLGIDAAAIACGMLFAVAIDPPVSVSMLRRGSGGRLVVAMALALAAFVWFFTTIHVGYEIRDAQAGVFRSRFTEVELRALSADRAVAWRDGLPTEPRTGREDQYRAEAFWHVRRRNAAWEAGDIRAAWCENLMLEHYFAPLVALPAYRWPDAQRGDAARRTRSGPLGYVSDANPFVIVVH